jgi:hypothetical protein
MSTNVDIVNGIDLNTPQGVLKAQIEGNSSWKAAIASLAWTMLQRKVAGCGNCYIDALIEIRIKLRKIAMQQQSKYELIKGVVLDAVDGDAHKLLVSSNVTDDLALYHICTNPANLRYFSKVPKTFITDATAYAAAHKITLPVGFPWKRLCATLDRLHKDDAGFQLSKLQGLGLTANEAAAVRTAALADKPIPKTSLSAVTPKPKPTTTSTPASATAAQQTPASGSNTAATPTAGTTTQPEAETAKK